MPYTNHSGVSIASGEFAQTMELALERSDWSGFATRRAHSAETGRLRGIGLGYYVESSGGGPQEEARVVIHPDGSADVIVGTYSHGQGHETAFAQIMAETFGVPFERINFIQGDTAQVKFGGGTGGSRSSQMGGIAVKQAGRRRSSSRVERLPPNCCRVKSHRWSSRRPFTEPVTALPR